MLYERPFSPLHTTTGLLTLLRMANDDTPVHAEDVTASVTLRVTACRSEEDGIYITVRCCDNHDMTTTQDSSRHEDPTTTTWWLDTIGRGVWEEATLEAEGIDPADDDEWEQWEQVRWIGRVTIDDLAPDEMPFGGDVIVTGTDGFVLREVAAGRTVDLWVPVDSPTTRR